MSENADETATNRKYKNSVFTKLFGTPEKALELYNAISGKNYPENTKIKIVTLSDVLYMEQLNDISFVIEDKLVVLIEDKICSFIQRRKRDGRLRGNEAVRLF